MPYSGTIIKAAEETKARTVEASGEGKNSDSPAYVSVAYAEQLPDVEYIRTVFGGTKLMRAAGKQFLKPHPMEREARWEDRKDVAVAYNGLKKTIGGLNGMIFRHEPSYSEDMPDELKGTDTAEGDMDNIDLQGRAFSVFWRHVADNALLDGHTWVHVESPRRGEDIRNPRDERESGFRPYWINLKKEQVTNWRYEIRAGRPVLTLIAYRESSVEPDGEFGEKVKNQIRVLREASVRETEDDEASGRVVGELWEFQSKDDQEDGGTGKAVDRWVRTQFYVLDPRITEIPVVAVYADRGGVFESTPPLLDLAYEQAEHYRVRSERQKSMMFSSIAVPYAFGREVTDEEGAPKVRWGADGMLLINDPEAKAGMLESHGYGLEATKEELEKTEGRMAAYGLRLLVSTPSPNPTRSTGEATRALLAKSESDAWLASFARNLEDAANECVVIHAKYRGLDTPGTVQLSREFHDQLIDPAMFRELTAAASAGLLSHETLFEELKHGRVLHVQHDANEERDRVERETETRMGGVEDELFGGEDEEDDEDLDPAA